MLLGTKTEDLTMRNDGEALVKMEKVMKIVKWVGRMKRLEGMIQKEKTKRMRREDVMAQDEVDDQDEQEPR